MFFPVLVCCPLVAQCCPPQFSAATSLTGSDSHTDLLPYTPPPLDTESHTREGTNTAERYSVFQIYSQNLFIYQPENNENSDHVNELAVGQHSIHLSPPTFDTLV